MGNFLVALIEIVILTTIGRGSAGKGGRIFTIVITIIVLVLVVVAVAKNTSIQ